MSSLRLLAPAGLGSGVPHQDRSISWLEAPALLHTPIHRSAWKGNSAKSISSVLNSPLLWGFKSPPSPAEYPTLSATYCGAVWICTRVHGASALRVYEPLVENYGKHLANSNRSTPLSESKARNLSSPVFVVWQQYGHELLLYRTRLRFCKREVRGHGKKVGADPVHSVSCLFFFGP
jgi:hypothetical protein